MKRTSLILLSLLTLGGFSCEQDEIFTSDAYACRAELPHESKTHPQQAAYEKLLTDMVRSGVPGMMLSVHTAEEGYWSGAAGFADLASQVALQPCHWSRVGSTVKTFTAVSVLLLQEDGLLQLDEPISKYLGEESLQGLENAQTATIRQLLQHSSGIYNYIQHLQFQTASLNDLLKTWHPQELLAYAQGEDAYFGPGEDVQYSNTNYILLGMLIEKVSGRPFYHFFQERIFTPMELNFTQFATEDPVPDDIIRGYVDLYSKLNLINATYYSGWDYFTADGGLISNAYDLNKFLTRLFQGELLSETSLQEMLRWQAPNNQDAEGFPTQFGLGIFRIETAYGPAYLHSGDAIGYFASMVYFPEQKVTISWAVNANYGKIDELTQSKAAMEQIFATVLQ